VVGWSMSAAMTAQLVTDALVMAIWRRGKPDALLHPLHGSVVPHVAGSAHRADDAVVGHQPLELLASVLGRFKWSSQRLMRSYDDQIEAASLRSFW
jgi:transposase InsO family protein